MRDETVDRELMAVGRDRGAQAVLGIPAGTSKRGSDGTQPFGREVCGCRRRRFVLGVALAGADLDWGTRVWSFVRLS